MAEDFNGKKVLITGGSSGIGLAVARQLAAQGAHLWLLARDPQKLANARAQVEAARRSPTQQVNVLAVDVANFDQVSAALTQMIKSGGAPDIVINSAGTLEPGYFDTLDIKTFHEMMNVDYFGTLHVLKVIVPEMISRKAGHIVNISSIAGLVGWYGYSAYGSAKFAVTGLCDHLRTELKPLGIKITGVYPPDVDTPQHAYELQHQPPELKALSAFWNKAKPAGDVAKVIVRGIARGQFTIIPGFDNQALVFIYKAFPGLAFAILDWSVRRVIKQTNSTRTR